MRVFHLKKNLHYRPTINLDRIWALVPSALLEEAKAKKDKTPQIDVTKYGFFKVLGNGHLPQIPVIIKAKFFSRRAEQRIKEVGGACVIAA